MNALEPQQIWWTAEDIAAAGLPDMPGSTRGVNLLATRPCLAGNRGLRSAQSWPGWRLAIPLVGFANGLRNVSCSKMPQRLTMGTLDRGTVWANFEGLTDAAKSKATERLKAIQMAEAFVFCRINTSHCDGDSRPVVRRQRPHTL